MATIDHHDAHAHPSGHAPDKAAGFMGLLVGVVLLLSVMYGIVQWTNSRFEGHVAGAAETPAAEH